MSGEYYRHYKGNVYQTVALAVPVWAPEQGQSIVVYRNVDTGELWARTASEFFSDVEIDGETVNRFSHIDGAADVDIQQKMKMNILGGK